MGYQALLFCTEEKTVRVITQVLSDLEFAVELSGEPFAAVKRLTLQHFDAVVVDCDDEQNAALLFKSARNSGPNHSALAVALVQGQAGIAKAFRIGANLVLTKPINVEQSKGTLRVARGLLRKADAAKSGATAAPVETSAPAALDFDLPRPPITPAPRPAMPPPPAPRRSTPVGPVASTSLEVEKEPAPEPDAAEAALLDSMPTPVAPPPPRLAPAPSAKRYPWQSTGKPFSEALPPHPAISLKSSVDGAEAEGYLPASANPAELVDSDDSNSDSGSLISNSAAPAAAAPARAKATPGKLLIPEEESREQEPFVERSRGDRQTERAQTDGEQEPGLAWSTSTHEGKAPSKSRSRGPLIAALIVLALAGGGYLAWPRLRPAVMNLPLAQKYLHPQAQPPASPAPAAPTTSSSTPEAATQAPANPDEPETFAAPAQSKGVTPEVIQVPQDQAKPDAGIPSSTVQPDAAAPPAQEQPATAPVVSAPAVKKPPQPIVVKNETKKPTPAPQVAEEVAPPSVGASSDATDKAVAKIVGTSTAASKPLFRPVRISQGVSEGLLIKVVQPIYTAAARQMRVEGPVQLEATIGKDGNISDVKVLSGNPMLTGAALQAVRRWKYKPYYLNGSPIEIQTEITVNFKLP